MGSIIKVNEYKDFNNNAIMTSDGAGVVTPNADGIKNVPYFMVKRDSDQTISNASTTKITFDSTVVESSSNVFDLTNNKWTVVTAGKYLITPGITFFDGDDNLERGDMYIYKNGATLSKFTHYNKAAGFRETNLGHGFLADLAVDDYIEMYAYIVTSDAGTLVAESDHQQTYIAAMKVID